MSIKTPVGQGLSASSRTHGTQGFAGKILRLVSLIATNPVEAWDRIATKMEVRADKVHQTGPGIYFPGESEAALADLEVHLHAGVRSHLAETQLRDIEDEVVRRIEGGLTAAPFTLAHCSGRLLARTCYAIVRALRPNVVLETGVAYGVTSTFILKALETNGQGLLHSVDLPPLGRDANRFVGALVPQSLRRRWHLHRGSTRRVLPKLLPSLGSVGLFVHDSLHTYRTMEYEFAAVTPRLAPGSMLIADDIQDNAAFRNWVDRSKPVFAAAIREPDKQSLFGITYFA